MRPRALLIAEAANPEWVSVPLIGWSLSQALRDVADTHLVTQVRNREAILRAGLTEHRDVSFIDNEAIAGPLWKLGERLRMGEGRGWTALQAVSALSYPRFEKLVWTRFGEEIRAGEWDLVHRITPLSPTISSPLARRLAGTGTPFILGPLNGGVPWPPGFDAARRAEREWLSYIRSAYKALPGRGRTLRHAAAILAGSRHTASEIPAAQRHKVIWLPENAIDPTRFSHMADHRADGPLRVAFVGRLVPYKGPDMLIEAARPLTEAGRLTIDIIGDGPMRPALEAMAGSGVTFHGWQAHEDVQKILARSQLLGFPSIREFGGGVVLEAMALGVPALVVDYAGPGELVDAATGFKVALGPRDEIVSGFRNNLQDLAETPEILKEKGTNARVKVARDFTWGQKAGQIARVYDWVLNGGEKPDLL